MFSYELVACKTATCLCSVLVSLEKYAVGLRWCFAGRVADIFFSISIILTKAYLVGGGFPGRELKCWGKKTSTCYIYMFWGATKT